MQKDNLLTNTMQSFNLKDQKESRLLYPTLKKVWLPHLVLINSSLRNMWSYIIWMTDDAGKPHTLLKRAFSDFFSRGVHKKDQKLELFLTQVFSNNSVYGYRCSICEKWFLALSEKNHRSYNNQDIKSI